MNRFLFNHITRPLKNPRGVAALMGVILGIVIMAAIAFNFLAESRQKQAGAILTYTSTNAFMIAEAGLRYAEKCLTSTEATCPSGVNEQSDWTDVDNSDNIAATAFGGGTFAIYFPGSTD
ncbi:MAG: Tfp pilus assembly protein PilX, partial [Nitrospinales bacterium]